jgi:hypothetical protein
MEAFRFLGSVTSWDKKTRRHIQRTGVIIVTGVRIGNVVCRYKFSTYKNGGTRWCSWLRHCDTNWKVAGSIPDSVIGIFHWHNPSGRTMTLELTQPLTEMSTRNISWWLPWPVRRANNLTTFMWQLSWYLGASNFWISQGLFRPVTGLLYIYI